MPFKKNLSQLPTTTTHDGSVSLIRLIELQDQPGSVQTMNYAWLDQGQQVQTHSHPDGAEYYLILKGVGQMLLGKEWFKVVEQDWVVVKPGVEHSLKNEFQTKLEFLTLKVKKND